jgi:hypothetical protein
MKVMDLSPDVVIEAARERSGLTDFGYEEFVEPLSGYIGGLKEHAASFSVKGAAQIFRELVDALENRLKIQDFFRRHPQAADERISRPIFISGLYRSATTKLQSLLCADPRFLHLPTWQTSFPIPVGETPPGGEDPRIAMSRAHLELFKKNCPQAHLAHPLSANEPSEEVPFMTSSFRVLDAKQPSVSFANWLKTQDKEPMYRDFRRTLQALQFQFKKPGLVEQRYCLKAPLHLGHIETLIKVFPDAKVIFTHRDPYPAVYSFTMLRRSLRGMYMDDVDTQAIGSEILDQASTALGNFLTARSKLPAEHFLDLRFEDIVTKLFDMIDDIYAFIDAPLPPEIRAILARADEQPDEYKSRADQHDPAIYGLSPERVHARNAAYLDWARDHLGELPGTQRRGAAA